MYSGVPKIIPVCVRAGPPHLVGVDDLGDAEVEHLDEVGAALALDEVDVLRLHVAVDDPVAVRGAQPLRDLHQDRARAVPVHRARLLQPLPEVLAVQVLHRDEHQPLGRLAEVRDVDDVLVADARRALGLLQEPGDQIGPARQVLEQDLERDLLLDQRVLGLVDRAHPALADLADDAVPLGQHLADQRIVSRWAGVADGHYSLESITTRPATPSIAAARSS